MAGKEQSKKYTCNEYRQEMILAALQRQLQTRYSKTNGIRKRS